MCSQPGIGKARLLGALADQADARGQLVLSGSASELSRDLPFWVFVDALDKYVEALEPSRLTSAGSRLRVAGREIRVLVQGCAPMSSSAPAGKLDACFASFLSAALPRVRP